MADKHTDVVRILSENRKVILENWIDGQMKDRRIRSELIARDDLRREGMVFIEALLAAAASGNLENTDAPEYAAVKKVMTDMAGTRLKKGLTRIETAAAFISFKDSWVPLVQTDNQAGGGSTSSHVVMICKLVDTLALAMYEGIVRRAEDQIQRQAREIMDLSTPVIQVWDGVVAAPLIGTLDSMRTQQFMERLLERIVQTNSPVALVDITGVPTIDTQTAQHLIETITAVKLLGAQVVLTGVRPAIAQTLVHLGIDLSDIITRSSLAAGLRVAMDVLKLEVVGKNGER